MKLSKKEQVEKSCKAAKLAVVGESFESTLMDPWDWSNFVTELLSFWNSMLENLSKDHCPLLTPMEKIEEPGHCVSECVNTSQDFHTRLMRLTNVACNRPISS